MSMTIDLRLGQIGFFLIFKFYKSLYRREIILEAINQVYATTIQSAGLPHFYMVN